MPVGRNGDFFSWKTALAGGACQAEFLQGVCLHVGWELGRVEVN